MKLFNRIRTLAGSALAAAALLVGVSMTAPASAQVAFVAPGGVTAYTDIPGCPVAPYDLQNVLSGMYGVDGLQRPVNQFGFPVDVYGNCLTPAPIGEIFNYQPAPFYINFLWARYHYHYYYNPGFVHLYGGPGVIIHGGYGAIPYGHTNVIIQQHYSAPQTVRPVGRTPNVYVAPGATINVRPGAPAGLPPAVARPAYPQPGAVTPPRAAGPSVFNRPAAAAPSTVTPPRSSAPSVFIRRH